MLKLPLEDNQFNITSEKIGFYQTEKHLFFFCISLSPKFAKLIESKLQKNKTTFLGDESNTGKNISDGVSQNYISDIFYFFNLCIEASFQKKNFSTNLNLLNTFFTDTEFKFENNFFDIITEELFHFEDHKYFLKNLAQIDEIPNISIHFLIICKNISSILKIPVPLTSIEIHFNPFQIKKEISDQDNSRVQSTLSTMLKCLVYHEKIKLHSFSNNPNEYLSTIKITNLQIQLKITRSINWPEFINSLKNPVIEIIDSKKISDFFVTIEFLENNVINVLESFFYNSNKLKEISSEFLTPDPVQIPKLIFKGSTELLFINILNYYNDFAREDGERKKNRKSQVFFAKSLEDSFCKQETTNQISSKKVVDGVICSYTLTRITHQSAPVSRSSSTTDTHISRTKTT